MTTSNPRRGGFTLIELLAVMGILALLTAITAAGISRVRAGQLSRNTEQTVSKLQLMLDQQWAAVVDQALQDRVKGKIPTQIVTACNNDLDIAGSAWAYMQTRRNFPNHFSAAKASIPGPGGYSLPPMSTFATLPASGASFQEEAAGILYVALANKANQGIGFDADDATQGAQGLDSTNSFKVFKDAYGSPITFIRYASGGFNGTELNSAPYINSSSSGSHDPLDPTGKFSKMFGGNSSLINNYFPQTSGSGAAHAIWGSAEGFNLTNRQPTVVSFGYDKVFPDSDIYGNDNVVGFRIRRQGYRGN